MGSRISRLLVPLVLIGLVVGFAGMVKSVTNSSPLSQFNVTPNILYLNWTNSPSPFRENITLGTNTTFSGITVKVFNETSALTENYSQGNTLTACSSGSLYLKVQNATHLSSNATLATAQNVTIIFDTQNCKAGRYRTTNFTIANVTQQNESANITVILDFPINDTSQTTGIGTFGGQFPINYTTYHSYYFNTSLVPNATGVTINLSGWSSPSDVDVFLFDNSSTPTLKARSTNKTSATENLRYQYLPKDAFWEIRVFGNSTSAIDYAGNILYTTLNVTQPSNSNFQIGVINYNAINASQTNNTNITLRNSGNISFSNVAETKELYYVQRFTGNGTNNYTFMVPDSTVFNKIKVLLNWTGTSNYSFNLYDLNENLVAFARNQHVQANTSGAAAEIYNETTSVASTTGRWILEVKNNTNVTNDDYSITVQMFVNPSSWLATNYSSFSFNRTGNNNSTTDETINLTIPNNSVDGVYEGQLLYLDGNGAGINLPIWINVTAPVLSVNNSMSSMTYRIDENIGSNLTRSFNFMINNSGSRDMTVTFTKIPGTLNFTYNGTNGTIPAKSYTMMNVNVTFNSANSTGIYEGAIFINATNETVALSSHPYQSFNLTLRLNLTTALTVNISQLSSPTLDNIFANVSNADNVTIKFKVYYINGTEIEAQNQLNTSNFSVWLTEGNVSARIPSSGNLTITNGTNPLYYNGFYNVNASIPANQVGGLYDVHTIAYFTRESFSFVGEGINRSLIMNNTGLKVTALNSTSLTLSNQTSYTFVVNVTNYGPLTASGATITFSENCTDWSISSGPIYSNCPSSSFAPTGFSSSCLVTWTILAGSDNASSCTGNIVGAPSTVWFNPNEVNVSVAVTKSTSTSTSAAAAATTTAAETTNNTLTFSIAEQIIYVEQNKSNTSVVQVKNAGSTSQTVTLGIDTLNSSWYSINFTNSTSISTGKVVGYLVTFTPRDAEIKDYSGSFKATGSLSNATSAFTLRVLPNAEKRAEIASIYKQLNSNFTSLSDEFNKTKKEGKNVTEAQLKYDMLKAKLDQANIYLNNGDYFSAYQLINEIENLYSETKDALSRAAITPALSLSNILGSGYLTYILIGGGIAAGVFVAYLFWPTKTPPPAYTLGPSKPSIGAAPKISITERLKFLKKIKEFFSKIFSKILTRGPKQTYQYRG